MKRALVGLAALSLSAIVVPGTASASTTGPGSATGPGSSSASGSAGKQPVAVGYGGAVSSVDLDASRSGLEVLRQGGNAMDAAVATAATLGVTDPYVAALGGGGFLTYYDARTHRITTFDGRETGPSAMTSTIFIDPRTGQPLPFDQAVTSGLSVGVPGTLAQWDLALRRFGSRPLSRLLRPAIAVARHGFTVGQEFHDQDVQNQARFADIVPTRELMLPGGAPPPVGSTFRNPDLADTYQQIARHGIGWFYDGPVARDIAATVQHPPVDPAAKRVVRPGVLKASDLASYRAIQQPPTHVTYRGLDVYGPPPPASGGSTVGEALNILENFHLSGPDRVQALHDYLEASRFAYADRNAYVGDPAYVHVPLGTLLSKSFARTRACLINPAKAATSPVLPGRLHGTCPGKASAGGTPTPYEGQSTTSLATTDRRGDVAIYTLTIEQLGGSALTVPHRGFILNNEMTDFSFTPSTPAGYPDPNLPQAGKRPRSSIAPTLVLRGGRPYFGVGSPGGATIITTVLQILLNRIDFGMTLPQAVDAPRASQQNKATTYTEQPFIDLYGTGLEAKGQNFALYPGSPPGVIGAATGVEFLGGGKVEAVAEVTRRHGGSALVVHPAS
jgi:gamma-glutamyltranspeptidase/glutathione hydrolase